MTHGRAFLDFRERWPGDFTQCVDGNPAARSTRGDPYLPGESVDEWGCTFVNLVPGVHGEVKNPLVGDYADLERISPPVELLEVDPAAANAFCGQEGRFVLGSGWARPFERMQFLRGTENLMLDIADREDGFFELLRIVHQFNCDQMEVWARLDVDALMVMDDWGSQRALLISPVTWREIFKPLYAEYARIAHDNGKKLFMHSDGYILDILEDLIEVGVDALNSQLFCMGIPDVATRAAGKITFWGEIDRQHLLPFGSVTEVEAGVAEIVQHLHRPEGGVIAQFEFAGDTRPENAEAVYRAWEGMTTS